MPQQPPALPDWAEMMLGSLWVRSGLAIVLALRHAPAGLTPAQLTKATGLPRTTLWEALHRLEAARLVIGTDSGDPRPGKRVVVWRLDPDAVNAALDEANRHLRTPRPRA